MIAKIKIDEIRSQEKWAKEGDVESQSIIGAKLANGDFVEQDELGALYWFIQAIKQGHTHSKFNAGTMLVNGDGNINKNIEVGMMLIESAANDGEGGACQFLSYCFQIGAFGKEKDESLSKLWHEKSSKFEDFKPLGKPIDLALEYGIEVSSPIINIK